MLERLRLPDTLDGNVWRYASLAAANRQHRHAELELNLVIQGTGTYLLGNKRYRIQPGHLLWLFPSQEHVLMEQTPDFAMWVAVFRRRAIRRTATEPGTRMLLQASFPGEACRRLLPADLQRVHELLSELAAARDEPGLLNAGLHYAVLYAWKCFQRAAGVSVREIHPAVERAVRMIRDDATNLSLGELAKRCGLSDSRLSRLFKEQTGFSVVEFRNRQRIERFWQFYNTSPRQTMLHAALEAGFGSYPQFHRVFRQVVGCAPRAYRHHEPVKAKGRP